MSDADTSTPEWAHFERTFEAPAELVWKMWTEADHFQRWYGPQGASIPVAKMDVRVGGSRLVCMEMQTPDGPMQMWFTGEYREVSPFTRLVYTDAMANEDGSMKSATEMGMPEGTPMETEVVVELSEADGSTTMAMTHVGVPAGSPGEGGWAMAIDKLAALLAA